MGSEKHEFTGAQGAKLAANFDRPSGQIRATAVFAHCFSCSKDIHAAKRISSRLAAMGIGVLRFDFTGLGHSDGEFANTNFSSNLDDLKAAVEYLSDKIMPPALLIGHSLGGTAVLNMAQSCKSVKAVATIGSPFRANHVQNIFKDDIEKITNEGEAVVDLGGRPFTIKKQFLDDLSDQDSIDAIHNLDAALLVLHSPLDAQVGIENASSIFTAAMHPKSYVSLDEADHLLTNEADAEYVSSVISAWASRYITLKAEKLYADFPEGLVRVREADAKGFLQDVVVDGKFQLTADEPHSVGGTGNGPSPYQFLSTALGACTSMTIRMYARHKSIPLEHVFVDVAHEKTHHQSMESQGKVDQFIRRIYLKGNLSDEVRGKLLEIANKCPVHRTLESGNVRIETVEGDNQAP